MKRISCFVVLLIVFSLTACSCRGGGESLANTPQEEYYRAYTLSGAGVSFDFSSIDNFEVTQRITISSDAILAANDGEFIEETALYQFDRIKEVSYSQAKWIHEITLSANVFSYGEYADGYRDNKWYQSQGSVGSENIPDYNTIINGFETSADYKFHRVSALFNPQHIQSYEGGKSGGKFSLTAVVKPDSMTEFLNWFKSDAFPIIKHTRPITNEEGVAEDKWIYIDDKADFVKSAKISVQTNSTQILSVVVDMEVMGVYDLGKLNISGRTDYKIGRVDVKDISTPKQA